MVLILIVIKNNLYGYSLHDFYEVARCILWRQKARTCTAGGSNTFYAAPVFTPAVGVNGNRYHLTRAHVL